MTRPLTNLCITKRARALLIGAGIQSVEALCQRHASDLLKIRQFGEGCLAEVREELAALGLALAGERSPAWIRFSDVARQRCHEQAQYASRAIDGRHGYPDLGRGLRFNGRPEDYHDIHIHRDDADEFVRRWHEFRAGRDPFGVPLTSAEYVDAGEARDYRARKAGVP